MQKKTERAFDYRRHTVNIWIGKTRFGWIWWLRIDLGSLHKCTLPLPQESLAIREGTVVARAEVDNLENEPPVDERAIYRRERPLTDDAATTFRNQSRASGRM